MKLFEKIKIKLKNGKSRQIRILGIPILQYDKSEKCKTKYWIPLLTKQKINNEKPVFYLKVNRDDYWSLNCVQQWINILQYLNADFFILCDKPNINKKILQQIIFYDSNINFIKSCKNNYLKKIVKNIATPYWVNATYAHLTTFFHAKKTILRHFGILMQMIQCF
jgi:hypothetical protein